MHVDVCRSASKPIRVSASTPPTAVATFVLEVVVRDGGAIAVVAVRLADTAS